MKTWVTADLHLGHANLISCSSKWSNKDQCRQFDSIEEHDNHVLSQLNKYVKEEDKLIIDGDVIFGDKNKLIHFMQSLNTQNVHLIYGNHDQCIRENRVLRYKDDIRDYEYHSQGFFKSIKERDSFYYKGRKVIIDHYPTEVGCWEDYTKDSVLIHGHVHGNLHDRRVSRRIDVGWDSSLLYFNEYRPFELDEAIELSII